VSAANRAALVQLRDQVNAQIDALLDDAPAAPAPPAAVPARAESVWMRMKQFATAFSYSPKAVSQWCKLGMPHIGKGHYCRIDVPAAKTWLQEGGPTRAAMLLGKHAHMRSVR
jgi:hypothetical protein